MPTEPNRKTTIPIRGIPQIVEWLIKNCTVDEIFFMADLARSRPKFKLLNSIITRLTDFNVYEVFYESFNDETELMMFRSAKRGEVAGLKAFAMACEAARGEIEKRGKQKRQKEED